MSVHEDKLETYIHRHNPIWDELRDVLKAHGVHTYSIFLDPEDHSLFAYAEVEDEARWEAIAQTEVCQRWWESMRELMPTNPDGSPKSVDLQEVFHLA
jgi:L-rhamnose mutarotase